jgi:hypothetical protein
MQRMPFVSRDADDLIVMGLVHSEQWLLDEDKLTFIILARTQQSEESHNPAPSLAIILPHEELSPADARVSSLPMIGDVNIFLKGSVPHLSSHLDMRTGDSEDRDAFEAEVEIMIAGKLCMNRKWLPF